MSKKPLRGGRARASEEAVGLVTRTRLVRSDLGDPLDLVHARLADHGAKIVSDRGSSFMAICPAHDDTEPSLHVSTGADGRALLRCYAGCTIVGAGAPSAIAIPLQGRGAIPPRLT
jgi:hypothetical protein